MTKERCECCGALHSYSPVEVVPIEDIDTMGAVSPRSIHKVKAYLEARGMIEPLVVYKDKVGHQHWDEERLLAARELGWDTVVITRIS